MQNSGEQTCNCFILLLIHSIKLRIRDTIPVVEELEGRGSIVLNSESFYCSLII